MTGLEISKIIAKYRDEGLTFKECSKRLKDEYGIQKTAANIKTTLYYYTDLQIDDSDTLVRERRAKLKTKQVRSDLNKIINKQITNEDIINEFKALLPKVNFKLHKKVKNKSKKKIKRAIVMHLSDTHFQAQIDGEEMGGLNNYSNKEEARRLAFFTKEVADFKKEHRDSTELVVVLNGDLIQGIIHDQESTPPITTQVAASLHLLTQSLSYLASEFNKVRVICTVGNHARMMHKGNKGRQTQEKWDSFATILHVGLKYALANYKNIEFEIPVTPYAYTKILGHNYFICHSDTVLSVGYVGKSINVVNAKNKINDLKEGIGPIDVVMIGHVHVDTKQVLTNGVTLLTNGSMSGIDPFALSIGITNSCPTQQMHEVTEQHKVGDLRSVYVEEADNMKDLDTIIEPFSGKF